MLQYISSLLFRQYKGNTCRNKERGPKESNTGGICDNIFARYIPEWVYAEGHKPEENIACYLPRTL